MTSDRPSSRPETLSRIDALVHEAMESRHVSGLSIALLVGGEIAWSGAYGTANIESREAVTPSHRFAAMSVTKPVIATALLQLHERGLFGLDEPANKYLDGAIRNEFEDEAPVTIRQLFTHTSGLPEDIGATMPEGKRHLDAHIRLVAQTARRPGETIVYANWGYDAMGLLIERLSGEPLDTYVRDHVLKPLGMTSSTLSNPPDDVPVALGHIFSTIDGRHHLLPLPDWPLLPASPAGGIFSTAEDLARFLAAHMSGGGGVIRPETAAAMQQVHAPDGAPQSGMGLTWRVTRSNGRKLICHGGDGGGYTAFAGAYPDEGSGVAVLTNTGGAQGARSLITSGVLALLAGDYPRARTGGPDIGRFGGRYRSNFWNIVADVRQVESGVVSITVPTGLINAYCPESSQLEAAADGAFTGRGGMFDGFQVAFEDGGAEAQFAGGVYPYIFTRESETIPAEQPTDETAVLAGAWRGTITTPIGALAGTLSIGAAGATISTPFGQDLPVEDLLATRGRVEGEFKMSIPSVGETLMFLRLRAVTGGRLTGCVWARTRFGEAAMDMELSKV